jgi:dGTPase
MRSPYQRDRDRVIHSTAFRRLKHKTQVFVYHEGDHYRTRLTHSLEVAQIARTLARALGLDEDLAETCALAHDLGHPPFGHAGEEALALCMRDAGGFDHNEQTFRVLTLLERHYADFDGLNLSWESLEGIVKHNGPLLGPRAGAKALAAGVPASVAAFDARWNLALDTFPSAEAQAAAIADDIAYNNHDLDDGLRAGFFALEELGELPVLGEIIADCRRHWPGLEETRLIHETIRRLIDRMVRDVVEESRRHLASLSSPEAVRNAPALALCFSPEMQEADRALKKFLFARMYRHYRVNRMSHRAHRVIADLFDLHMNSAECLPPDWAAYYRNSDHAQRARVVCDYLAGMTDKYALDSWQELFS